MQSPWHSLCNCVMPLQAFMVHSCSSHWLLCAAMWFYHMTTFFYTLCDRGAFVYLSIFSSTISEISLRDIWKSLFSVMKCLCKQTCSHRHASNPFIVQLQWQWLNCIVTKVERCTTGRNNKPQWTWYHFLLSGTIDKASTNEFFHLCSFAMLCKSANREQDGESLFELIYSLPVH